MKNASILSGVIVLLLIVCGILLNLTNISSDANIIYSTISIIIIILLFFIIPKNKSK